MASMKKEIKFTCLMQMEGAVVNHFTVTDLM
jgi:hypothetical protein